jgi:hypothetical protein
MKKGWVLGLCMVTISIGLLIALTVSTVDIASGHSGGGGGGGGSGDPFMSEPFVVVIEPGFPIHLQDPQYVTDRALGNILRYDEFANIMRQNWIDAFINRGTTQEERDYRRHYVIERQLGYEQNQFDAEVGVIVVNMNYYQWQAIDFAMDWGTAIAQDVTQVPYNEVYDWSKHGTALVMVGVAAATDSEAQDEYSQQAVDEVIEAAVDVYVGDAVSNITNGTCNAPETLAELATTGVKGVKSMFDHAAQRSDRRPGVGWAPTYAR